jgi:hypothetical protein
MTMLDKFLEFGDAAAAAATAGTALVLPNQIDTSLTVPDLGNGQPIYFVCSVATAIVAANAGTLEVQLVSDSTDTIATDTSVTYHLRSPSITTANNSTSNPAGKVLFAAPLPLTAATGSALGLGGERFLGARLLAGSHNISSGAVDCYLTTDPAKYRAYANAI